MNTTRGTLWPTSAVQGPDTAGASGRVAFDRLGDTRTKVLTLDRVDKGAWVGQTTEQLSGS